MLYINILKVFKPTESYKTIEKTCISILKNVAKHFFLQIKY